MTQDRYVDEGLRVVIAEDWFIYVVREEDNLMFQYCTEDWYDEWGRVCVDCYCGNDDRCRKHSVADLIPYAHNHVPVPIRNDDGTHLTLEDFLADCC